MPCFSDRGGYRAESSLRLQVEGFAKTSSNMSGSIRGGICDTLKRVQYHFTSESMQYVHSLSFGTMDQVSIVPSNLTHGVVGRLT